MKNRDIKLTPEHPELDIKHIAKVIVRKGLKPVEAKKSVSLRVGRGCSLGSRRKALVTRRA